MLWGHLLSREQLEAKGKVKIPWYEYQQVPHLFNRLQFKRQLNTALTPFEQIINIETLKVKGLISLIYNLLNLKATKGPFAFQLAWQMDLGKTIDEPLWNTLWNSSWYRSRNIISMLTYKMTYHWYLTTHKLHRFNADVQNKCWKWYDLRGTSLHCFWVCRKLQIFWKQVVQQIKIIMGLQIPRDPELVILNIWRLLKIDTLQRELTGLLLCAAWQLTAVSWKTPRIPIEGRVFENMGIFFAR